MNSMQLNDIRKNAGLSIEELSNLAKLPKSTVEKILFGVVKHPRIDTMQAIERALGLAPAFTEEERALGLSDNHPIALSNDDRELINLFAEAEEKLGKAYVRGVKQMVRLAIDTKGQP